MPQYDYFVRITHSYQQCISILSRWSLECDKMVVYEHIGSATEKVHIHIAIEGSRVQSKALKVQAEKVSQVPLKGNENCSMKQWDKSEAPLVYMTKGNLDPKYLKGWTEAEAAEWKSKWVEPTNKQVKQSEVQKIYEEKFSYEEINKIWKEICQTAPISQTLFLRRRAMQEAMKLNKQMLTPKTQTDARTLYLTYCYRNGIRLDKNDPYHKFVSWETTNSELFV